MLTIAGSDSGGGAGIQADLKAFAACGAHGMSAITAVTAQNTVAVTAVYPLPPQAVIDQVKAVVDDIGVDGVKIGMLGNRETIEAVDKALDLIDGRVPVVLDPVMVSESGARLLDEDAEDALRTRLLPRMTVVTPNLPEARVLAKRAGGAAESGATGADAPEDEEAEALARAIHALGPDAVVVTGGHREQAIDVFFDGRRTEALEGDRYEEGSAHGSGCTHSSVLAVHLARGDDALEAARQAKRVASEAVKQGLRGIGEGPGPVNVTGI